MPDHAPTTIETAVDALLQIIVKGERERFAAANPEPKPRDFAIDTPSLTRDPPDLAGLISDPIGTACRAELRRLGHSIHAAGGIDALDEAIVHIAEMDMSHADWRAIVLETAWGEIGRSA